MTFTQHLSKTRIVEIRSAILQNFGYDSMTRNILLTGLPISYRAMLPGGDVAPAASLLLDLTQLNRTERLDGGEVPLKIFVETALNLGPDNETATVLREVAADLEASSKGAPALSPGPVGTAAKVVITCLHPDTSVLGFVDGLTTYLRESGVDPWLDRQQFKRGAVGSEAVRQAIDTCDAAIVVVTNQNPPSAATADELELLLARSRREPQGAFRVLFLLGPEVDRTLLANSRIWTDLQPLNSETIVLRSLDPFQIEGLTPWIAALLEETRPPTTSSGPRRPASDETAQTSRDDPGRGLDPAGTKRLAKQGLIEAIAADIPVNSIAQGRALVVPDSGPLPAFELPGGVRVTLLSPDMSALRKVAKVWGQGLERAGLPVPHQVGVKRADATQTAPTADRPGEDRGRRDRTTGAPPPTPPPGSRFGGDRDIVNGSSLAFLVEFEGASCLITGAAHPDRMERYLRRLVAERGVERLPVDLMVVPHQGSRRSITPALLDLVDCRQFVVATNGAVFRHPDVETIELLGKGHASPVTVYFNYRSVTTEPYADEEVQRRLNIVAVFPEDGQTSTIAVSSSNLR